jgi:hypothetical protein
MDLGTEVYVDGGLLAPDTCRGAEVDDGVDVDARVHMARAFAGAIASLAKVVTTAYATAKAAPACLKAQAYAFYHQAAAQLQAVLCGGQVAVYEVRCC